MRDGKESIMHVNNTSVIKYNCTLFSDRKNNDYLAIY